MKTKRVRVRVTETSSRWGYAIVEVPDGMDLVDVPHYVMNEIGYSDADWIESVSREDSIHVDRACLETDFHK